jgi:abortive infection bacteriophage resistance protein
MKRLRQNGVSINGSTQKQKLRRLGYFHAYKGFRFSKTSSNRLPISNFDEIARLHDLDMQLKTTFYPQVMQIETALKNIVLEQVLAKTGAADFETIWKVALVGYKDATPKKRKEAVNTRLRLRVEIDQLLQQNHNSKDVIKHFSRNDKEVPIWAIFEIMTLGNFANFYSCLSDEIKQDITNSLRMPNNLDPKNALKAMLFTFKDLRNAIAHNSPILDVRFKQDTPNARMVDILQSETSIKNIDFANIVDYVILIAYLMVKIGFTKTETKRFIADCQKILENNRQYLDYRIYSKIITSDTRNKLNLLKTYVQNA